MSTVLFSVFSAKTSLEQFHDKIRELSDLKEKPQSSSFISSQLQNREIRQCVIGPSHIAFLLDDQRVCRLPFLVSSDKFDQAAKDTGDEDSGPSKSVASVLVHSAARSSRSDLPFTISGEALNTLSGQLGRWGSPRTGTSGSTTNRTSSTIAGTTASSTGSGGIRVRGRIVRAAMRGRTGNSWIGSRPVIPASAVPEDLVAQAQVVLQGKSTITIIRELQRTNLDVNLAVNNLLSRDDDDPDDQDEGSESYLPGDELISIFDGEDNSFVVDPDSIFPEDIIYGSSLNRPVSRTGVRAASNEGNSRDGERERDISGTVRQCEKYYMDLLNIDQNSSKSGKGKSLQKGKTSPNGEALHVVSDLEFWKTSEEDDGSTLKFSHIAALHSELIAVSTDGKLHQWKWQDAMPMPYTPGQHSHSRANDMRLKEEKIAQLDACNVRASVLTESGKVATWLDETLSAVAFKLEHAAQSFTEFRGQAVTALHVCDLYSCVQLANGSLFWWGVFPFEQRRKLMDKVKQKAKKSAISGSSLIQAGTQVCLRSCPLYYPGAVAFTTVNGQPKVGELLEQAWTITEKCRFKILKNGKKDDKKESGPADEARSEYGEPSDGTKKRKRTGDEDETTSKAKEEQWNLKDVIFVEDVRNVPVGKVLKVDGAYALVNFTDSDPSKDPEKEKESSDLSSVLKSCRLVRKDELQIVRWTTPPKMSECFQKVPKQLSMPGNSKVLTMALDTNGVHTLLKSPSNLRYAVFSLASGRVEPGGSIPSESAAILSSSATGSPTLYTAGMDSLTLLRDGNGCVFPLVKDNIGGIKDPNWVNLPPIICMAMGSQMMEVSDSKSHAIVAVIVVKNQTLIKCISKSDVEGIKESLKSLEGDPAQAEGVIMEKCDGNRNILHKAVAMCFPTSAKETKKSSSKSADKDSIAQANLAKSLDLTQRNTSRDLDDIFPLEIPIPTTSWPPDRGLQDEPSSDIADEDSKWVPVGEKTDNLTCVNAIINNDTVKGHLLNLLKEKDATGCTPFMSAVRGRAYAAGLVLLEAAKKQATVDDKLNNDLFISMVNPSHDANLSPFHMLCRNDTCSFTWTGTTHINQDIFECRTCGLVGTLCCCTECAKVCHIGHDCKLKKTSPTAYCDCWEKCACKSLIPGEQNARLELLKRLISETDLATRPNKEGEHILLFLAKTVARQGTEQGQYNANKSSDTKSRTSNVRSIGTPALPAHDLEQPKFAKLALEQTLKDWKALRSMLMSGCNLEESNARSPALDDNFASMIGSSMLSPEEQMKYLKSQEGTARLDTFIHYLLVKCNVEYLEALLCTLRSTIADAEEKEDSDAVKVARRFVRAVCRVFVVLASSIGPNSNKRKGTTSVSLPLSKCRRVFTSLNTVAAKELAYIADAIFAPVRLGVVYPSAPFTLPFLANDGSQACEDLFSVLPLPARTSSENTRGLHVRFEETQNERDEERPQSRVDDMEMDGSTHDEQNSPAMPLESQEEQNNDGEEIQNAESDMELDLLAESESDSEDSNGDDVEENQRSGTNSGTNRSGHSRADLVDSGRSHDNDGVDYYSGAESTADVDDEDGEVEEEDDDDTQTIIEPIVQRLISGESSSRTPHALQWAVRNAQRRDAASEPTTHVYVGTSNIRRNAAGASASADLNNSGNALYCMPSALARTFGLVVKELSDVLSLSPTTSNLASHCIPLKQADLKTSRSSVDVILEETWQWLWKVMETTEAQLRFGASLTAVSDPSHPHHPLHDVQLKKGDRRRETTSLLSVTRNWNPDGKRKRRTGAANETSDSSLRQDFLTYLLSLMRGSDSEHGDSLPKLEMTSLRHVAYILDAFVYYLRSNVKEEVPEIKEDGLLFVNLLTCDSEMKKAPVSKRVAEESDEESETDDEIQDDKESRNRFFKRSDSTLVLGFEPSDPFTVPIREGLPLADKPHLLNPTARRDQLFGSARNSGDNLHIETPEYIGYGAQATGESSTPSTSSKTNIAPEASQVSANFILGRWRMCLELFGRLFLDDVGAEPHSVLNELSRFDVKETKFRRDMEKLRNNHQKDLYIEEVERNRIPMIRQTFRKLDTFFGRRGPSAVPVSIHRLRVSFKDEPGEGSGVVRSFYTAIGEALLSDECLPALDSIFAGSAKDESHAGLVLLAGLTQRLKSRVRERERERRRSGTSPGSSGMMLTARMRREREHARLVMEREGRQKLNVDAKPYVYDPEVPDTSDNDDAEENDPIQKAYLGRRLYSRVYSQHPQLASQITGMLLELSATQIILLLTQEEILKTRITEAVDLLNAKEKADPSGAGSSQDSSNDKSNMDIDEEEEDFLDNSPLFFQPGKTGFYSPRHGKTSVERLNCFRNVGRIIGLCLLQNELSPMSFNRHVIKYLLGREVSWHDLAFFDPTLYESLRQLIQDSTRTDAKELFAGLDLTFCIELSQEEGGTSVELITNGKLTAVTPENVQDYVKRYAEYRMITVVKKPLESLRRGLLDVLPVHTLDGLTAEDLRLLLNGSGDISMQQLMSYTSFGDETGGDSQDKLSKFKRWFWSIVESMTAKQKQDMLYFWTSSPAMPASSEGFQPMPSVTVKPANDHQLPTANTCISRLYIPLYSSKSILKSKLLLAIKTRTFGFV